jgi:hypothetical protein
MLGITHHLIVQYCAYQLFLKDPSIESILYNEKGWCEAYEILGDDIAIFHKDLAEEYLRVMTLIGVPINVKKSVISISGKTIELAKRTIHEGKDVSAISFKDILSSAPFAQRIAIVDRVTRRGIMSLHRAADIVTNFYGEEPNIRKSYIYISMFLRAYKQGIVSFLDVLFLLFLIKKYSKSNIVTEYSYQDKLVTIIENVVASINNGRTSYSDVGTVFPIKLFSEHCVEFYSLFFILYPKLYYKVQENRLRVSELLHSYSNASQRVDALTYTFLVSLLYPDVNAPRPHGLEAFIIAIIQDLKILFPEEKFFEIASGANKIRTALNYLHGYENLLRNSSSGASTLDPMKFIGLTEARPNITNDISKFDGSSIDDLVSANETLINYVRFKDLYMGIDVKKNELKYSPISDFTEIFDSVKELNLSDEIVIPYLHVRYDVLVSNYNLIRSTYSIISLLYVELDLSFIPFILVEDKGL